MDATANLGALVIHEARASYAYWLANDFEKVLINPPMFDRNQANLILNTFDDMRTENDRKNNIPGEV
jgi:hypothetical protein